MFDFLGPIGSISTDNGQLEYGHVGATDCVYLRFVGDLDVVPCLIYTPEEMRTLRDMLSDARTLAATTSPGTILRVGAMRPKPITLRVALIHPHTGSPFVLLRLFQGEWKQDIVVNPEAALTLFTMGASSHPTPVVSGQLRRNPDGSWRLGGKTIAVLEGLSPGTGYYGEYLHPDEVTEGEELDAWTFPAEGREFLACFRTRQRWRAPTQVEERTGQEGDLAWQAGLTYRCRKAHQDLASSMLDSKKVDATWAAKIALSALLCGIKDGDDQAAHAIFLGRSPDPILQIGIKAIESGQTSVEDIVLYQQVSCYFHALNPDRAAATRAVNGLMEKLLPEVPKGRAARAMLLRNWYLHLVEIHEGPPPTVALGPWQKAQAGLPGKLVPKAICYTMPHPWVIDWTQDKPRAIGPQQATAGGRRGATRAILLGLLLFVFLVMAYSIVKDENENTQAPSRPTPSRVTSSAPSPALDKPPLSSLNATPPLSSVGLVEVDGPVSLAGVDPKEKYRVDRAPEGMKMLESGPGWARLESGGEQIVLAARQTGKGRGEGVRSTRAVGFASTALLCQGKVVLKGGDPVASVGKSVQKALRIGGLQMHSRADKITGFSLGKFHSDTIALGQPLGAGLLNTWGARDVVSFRKAVTKENANIEYWNGETILSIVAAEKEGSEEYVKALLSAGAQVKGEPASKILPRVRNPEVVKLLVKAGLDVNTRLYGGRSKLFFTDLDMMKTLLALGADTEVKDKEGRTALFTVNKKEELELLLKAGAKVHVKDKEGNTPLHVCRNEDVLRGLVKAGLDVNARNSEGKTPLMSERANKKALLALGANPDIKDKQGRTAKEQPR